MEVASNTPSMGVFVHGGLCGGVLYPVSEISKNMNRPRFLCELAQFYFEPA